MYEKNIKKICSMAGSNRRPSRYKHDALPTKLMELVSGVGFEPTKLTQ